MLWFKRKPHLEVKHADTGQKVTHWVRIVAANGEILLASESYSSESNARRAAHNLASHTGLKVKA